LLYLVVAQLSGFFDTMTFTAFLQVLRKAIAESPVTKALPDNAHTKSREAPGGKTARGGRKTSKGNVDHVDKEHDESPGGESHEHQGLKKTSAHEMDGLSFCVQSLIDVASFLKVIFCAALDLHSYFNFCILEILVCMRHCCHSNKAAILCRNSPPHKHMQHLALFHTCFIPFHP
jgi:hypothetical protein